MFARWPLAQTGILSFSLLVAAAPAQPAGAPATKSVAVVKPGAPGADAFAAGKKLAGAGDHRGAIDAYVTALKTDPDNATFRSYKAASHLALRQLDLAQQEIDEATRRDAKNSTAWEIAGQIKISQSQIEAGRQLYDKAAQLAPGEAGSIYTDLAAVLAARGDERLAVTIDAALKSAAAADPPGLEALFQLGQGYASAGRAEAKGYLQRYIDIAGKLPETQRDARKLRLARQLLRAMTLVGQ